MFKNNYSDIFKTKDNIEIFHIKNFKKLNNKKPLLVFNYGLVCNIEHWREQVPFFDERGYQIIMHDYRFHFKTSGTNNIEQCKIEHIAYDIYELLMYIGSKKNILLGHSMGVNICLEFSYKYPEITMGNILISGTVIAPHEVMFFSDITKYVFPKVEQFLEKYPNTFEVIWKTAYMNPIAKFLVHYLGFNYKRVPKEFIDIYIKRIGELEPKIFFQLLKEMKNHKIKDHLEEIEVPSLIIGGNKDIVIPNYLQYYLNDKLTNSQIYIVEEGYHVPQMDFPESVNNVIEEFINEL